MTVDAAELARVETLLGGDTPADWLARLRQELPGRAITVCDAGDLTEGRPYREYPGFELYLVDGSGHCWSLTPDPDAATGLLVARRRVKVAS
jgi:hypothetical protein